MNFTTTTEIARKWKKAFDNLSYATVLSNNKDIWMVLGKEMSHALLESWILQQIKEELWELWDPTTMWVIEKYRTWNKEDSLSLDNFKKEYEL